MKTFPRKPIQLDQLDLFRPKANRPQWKSLSPKTKRQVTTLLAQLIAEFVRDQTQPKDQKESIDE